MNSIYYKQYYDILNIEPNTDIDSIKKAYRKLSLKYHPDKNNNSSDMFNKITTAYEFLINNPIPPNDTPYNTPNNTSINI